jgi:nitrite reductase/ring-hydroxylating ferredoxin subunit
VSVAGCPIALFLVDDEVFAIDDICIHQERSLSKGTLLNGQVICPGHQWKFDPRTGEPEDQDGCQATYAVQVTEEGAILVAPEPVTPRKATSNDSSTHPANTEAS